MDLKESYLLESYGTIKAATLVDSRIEYNQDFVILGTRQETHDEEQYENQKAN